VTSAEHGVPRFTPTDPAEEPNLWDRSRPKSRGQISPKSDERILALGPSKPLRRYDRIRSTNRVPEFAGGIAYASLSWSEGRGWLEQLLELAGAQVSARARARALYVSGRLGVFILETLASRTPLDESIAHAREVGDAQTEAYALSYLARLLTLQGDYASAGACAAASIAASLLDGI